MSLLYSSSFKYPDIELRKNPDFMESNHFQNNSFLTRYRSAPSSFFENLTNGGAAGYDDYQYDRASGPEIDNFVAKYMLASNGSSGLQGYGDDKCVKREEKEPVAVTQFGGYSNGSRILYQNLSGENSTSVGNSNLGNSFCPVSMGLESSIQRHPGNLKRPIFPLLLILQFHFLRLLQLPKPKTRKRTECKKASSFSLLLLEMGTLVGHVAPGFAFVALGLWHLINHIMLHSQHPNSYISLPWFPTSKSRYLELLFIMIGSSISISMELFIGPEKHQPFDTDGTIPSNHLHNFEHSSISLTFFTYGAFAIVLDKFAPRAQHGLTQLIAAVAFSQQLLMFHLHSADHMGVEGQYHLLLQSAIVVCLATTLMGIGYPKSFMISFIRSVAIFFQGIWLILMGYMLWTPGLIPKGCFIHEEDGHQVVRCSSQEALHRAKSLVNLQFSWFLILVTVFSVSLYLILMKLYGSDKVEYSTLSKEEEDLEDVESQKKRNSSNKFGEPKSLNLQMGRSFVPIDMER